MPPTQLRGAPTVVEHVYDDAGRLLRTITASPWTSGDRALMLARQQYRDSLCSGCGQPRDRAWHPAMEGWYEVAVFTCHACLAREKAHAKPHQRVAVRDSYDDPQYEHDPLDAPPKVTFLDPEDIEVEAAAAPAAKGGELSG